jgi:type III secretion protein J
MNDWGRGALYTRASRLVGAGLRVALLAVAVALAGCEATVASGLDEAQANAVVVALEGDGIGASKEASAGTSDEARFDVRVPADDVGHALVALSSAELPRDDEPGIAEVFGEGGLVPTATEERARYVSALGGELARSIEGIEGVLDARVHIALPEPRDFALDQEAPRPRASVLVKKRAAAAAIDETQVQSLVAFAVSGMQRDDVAVVIVEVPTPAASQSTLTRIGPIAVTHGSAPILKGVLGGAFALDAILALALVFVWMRKRRELEPQPASNEPT